MPKVTLGEPQAKLMTMFRRGGAKSRVPQAERDLGGESLGVSGVPRQSLVPLGGGLPIVIGTERIGGLGLSGAPDQAADEKCARAGLAAAAASLK